MVSMVRRSAVVVLHVMLLAGPAAAQQPTAPPVVTAGAGGFEIRSADSAFRLRIRGYVHGDFRGYPADEEGRGTDAFLLRRARPVVEATFYRIFDQSASRATAAGVGLNWYLNRNLKIAADYEWTGFVRGAANGADRPDEHAVFTRFQVAF
jgi:phosphate-selective porin